MMNCSRIWSKSSGLSTSGRPVPDIGLVARIKIKLASGWASRKSWAPFLMLPSKVVAKGLEPVPLLSLTAREAGPGNGEQETDDGVRRAVRPRSKRDCAEKATMVRTSDPRTCGGKEEPQASRQTSKRLNLRNHLSGLSVCNRK